MLDQELGFACSRALGLAPGLGPAARAQSPAIAGLGQLPGADRKAALAAGAEAEGEVLLCTSVHSDGTGILRSAFEGKYGVEITILRGRSAQILWRMSGAEAGRSTFAGPAELLDNERKWRSLFRDVTKSVSRK